MTTFKNNRPVIVGIFILLGLAILVVTIFTLGGQKKTFVKSYTIYAVFNDVGGLIKGGNVWFSGVKVGTVKNITFYQNSQVLVTMNIEKEAQSHIHKDAMAKIGSDGLIGNKIVIIYGGSENMPQAEANDLLHVENIAGTDDMLATLQANNINLLEITNDFKRISKKIDSGKGTLATLLNDPAMANKLSNTFDNLQATASNFKAVSINSKDVLLNLKDFSNKINKPGNSINDVVTDTVMYASIKGTLFQLKKAADAVTIFTGNLEKASERLNQDNNVAGVLLNDSLTAASIKITLKNLETSSQKLDADLEALQHNFLLRGYFRKKK
ncbi:MlaD family protein [Chitinophaga sancti]|uniref:MlaD family protein n=1 Tax=Chitinophaga sancti TaxID=1004 RepID=UPI002A7594B9|nr:MlaD family protein [Chitinophaga sancti]WPQ61409.1 MlaD family protein [Chitinophaga sancti]